MTAQDPNDSRIFSHIPSEAVRQRLKERLRSLPVQDAVRQSLSKELGTLLNRDTLNTTLRNLVTGRASLDQSLLELTTKASQIVDTVLRDEQKRVIDETRANLQIQTALLQHQGETPTRPAPRPRGTYVIRGQVLNSQTQQPIAGAVVQAIDRDVRKDDFLGVSVTDKEGRYEIAFRAKDFREGGENQPEVVLQVGSDRQTILYTTEERIEVRPKQPANVTIALPEDKAEAAARLIDDQQLGGDRLQKLNQTMAYTQLQHLQVQAIGNALKEQLNATIQNLQPPSPS